MYGPALIEQCSEERVSEGVQVNDCDVLLENDIVVLLENNTHYISRINK